MGPLPPRSEYPHDQRVSPRLIYIASSFEDPTSFSFPTTPNSPPSMYHHESLAMKLYLSTDTAPKPLHNRPRPGTTTSPPRKREPLPELLSPFSMSGFPLNGPSSVPRREESSEKTTPLTSPSQDTLITQSGFDQEKNVLTKKTSNDTVSESSSSESSPKSSKSGVFSFLKKNKNKARKSPSPSAEQNPSTSTSPTAKDPEKALTDLMSKYGAGAGMIPTHTIADKSTSSADKKSKKSSSPVPQVTTKSDGFGKVKLTSGGSSMTTL
ncbi:unnamed protein product [Sympodiomycopsis kandeliae]